MPRHGEQPGQQPSVGVRVLGPVALRVADAFEPVPAGQRATILARVAFGGGQEVTVDQLIDAIWADRPPAQPRKSVQVQVANLRRWLRDRTSDPVIESTARGYRLVVERDLDEVLRRIDAARASAMADDLAVAERDAAVAVTTWCDDAFPELVDDAGCTAELVRLQELRCLITEEWLGLRLRRGDAAGLVPDLERWIATHPYRESGYGLLLEALAQTGRLRDASLVIGRAARALAEVGLEPSGELQRADSKLFGAPDANGGTSPAPTPDVMVGRGDLVDTMSVALFGGPAVVAVVSGEPGIGKSRLAEAMIERASTVGFASVHVRCAQGEVLQPRGDVANEQFVDRRWARSADRSTVARSWLGVDRPTLLVIDDAHAADAGTMERLSALVGELDSSSELRVLVTTRPAQPSQSSDVGAWRSPRRDDVVRVEMSPLAREPAADIVRAVAPTLTAADVASVVERAGGNPLFLRELARATVAGPSVASTNLDEIVRRRLSTLDESQQLVVDVLAVLATSTTVDIVAAGVERSPDEALSVLASAEGHGLVRRDDDRWRLAHQLVGEIIVKGLPRTVWLRINRALASALHAAAESGRDVDDELLARIALDSMPLGRPEVALRATLAAAEHARDRFDWLRAASWLERAVDVASLIGATDEMRRELLLERGRLEADAGLRDRARDTLLRAAALARSTGDIASIAHAAVALSSIYARVTEDELLVELIEESLGDMAAVELTDRVQLLAGLGLARFYDLDETGPKLAEQAVELAESAAEPRVLAIAYSGIHLATSDRDPEEYRRLADRTVTLAREARAFEPLVMGLLNRHKERLVAGRRDAARADLDEARSLIVHGGSAKLRWIVETWGVVDALIDGRLRDVERSSQVALSVLGSDHPDAVAVHFSHGQAVDLLEGRGAPTLVATGAFLQMHPIEAAGLHGTLAYAAVLEGERELAERHLRLLAESDYGGSMHSRFEMLGLAGAGEAAWMLGRGEHGDVLAERLRPYAGEQTVLRLYQAGASYWGPTRHAIGCALAVAGRTDEARRELSQAIEDCLAFGSPYWAARSERVLAQL